MHLMALDWRKAFDSIKSESLILALKRFGMPDHVMEIVRAIYTNRRFHVSECGVVPIHTLFASIVDILDDNDSTVSVL